MSDCDKIFNFLSWYQKKGYILDKENNLYFRYEGQFPNTSKRYTKEE